MAKNWSLLFGVSALSLYGCRGKEEAPGNPGSIYTLWEAVLEAV